MSRIENASLPYPDFVNGTRIDADKFDANNNSVVGKLNQVIAKVNDHESEIMLGVENVNQHRKSGDHDDRYVQHDQVARLDKVVDEHKHGADHDDRYPLKSDLNAVKDTLGKYAEVNSNLDVTMARLDENGVVHGTLKERIDKSVTGLAEQLENIMNEKRSLVRNSDFEELPFISSRSSVYNFTPDITSPQHGDKKSLEIKALNYESSSDANKDFAIILTEQLLSTEKLRVSFFAYPTNSDKSINVRMAYSNSGKTVSLGTAHQWNKIDLELDLTSMTVNNSWLYFNLLSSQTLYISDLNVTSDTISPNAVSSTQPISFKEVNDKLIEHPTSIQNSPGLVERMIQVGQTYLDNINSLVYGNSYTAYDKDVQTVGGKYQIDCSSFANLVLHGVPYNRSRYSGLSENEGSSLFFHRLDAYKFRFANQIAKYAFDRGYAFIAEPDFSNVQPGDVLFFSWTNGGGTTDLAQEVRNNAFMKIDHVGIYLHRQNENYHSLLQLDNGFTTVFYTANETYMNQCVLVARFPLTNLEPMYPLDNIVLYGDTPKTATNTTVVGSYKLSKNLVKGRYYTIFIDGQVLTSNCYFIIQVNGQTVYSDYGRADGFNGTITCRFPYLQTTPSDIITIAIGSSVLGNSRSATVNWVSMYEGYARNKTEYTPSLKFGLQKDFPLETSLISDLNTVMVPYYKYALDGDKIFFNLSLPLTTLRTGNLVIGNMGEDAPKTTQRIPCNLIGENNEAVNGIIQVSSTGAVAIYPYVNTVKWKNALANGVIFRG